MPDRRPKTHAKKMQFNYLVDRMKQLEWEIHHPIAMDWAIPREWHEIAARTRKSEKMRITLRVEKDVVRFFKSLGAGYQVKMDDVLASFMHAKLAGILREEGDIDAYFNDSETRPRTHIGAMDEMLAALAEEFKKPDLHCSRLNHNQIVRFATEVAKLRVLCFGLISRKATLGNYADDIKKDDKLFYNKNAQYLLERVGAFMEEKSLTEAQLSVVFEEGNFDYGKLKSLIRACRRDPKRRQSRTLRFVNPSFIYSKPKKEEPLLQLADLVAHALFRCVDDGPSTHGVMETRYLSEISGKFYAQEDSRKVLGHGIYPVHTLSAIKVTDKVADFLKKMNSN